jgi:hypothetical protein
VSDYGCLYLSFELYRVIRLRPAREYPAEDAGLLIRPVVVSDASVPWSLCSICNPRLVKVYQVYHPKRIHLPLVKNVWVHPHPRYCFDMRRDPASSSFFNECRGAVQETQSGSIDRFLPLHRLKP